MPTRIKAWLSQMLQGEAPAPPARPTARPAPEPYHAVGIQPGPQCCEAARQFGKMRFLSAKAPRLPLPDCDVAACTCRYNHFSDRRSGLDRRAVYDYERERGLGFPNRRQTHGRRSTDAVRGTR